MRFLPRVVMAALCLSLTALLAGQAGAAELVMFTREGCPWCARFEREVGPVYGRTDEGRLAPLRRVNVTAGGSTVAGLREPVIAAPTFVLIDDGREIGRITGYQGDDAFWGLLGKMLGGIAATGNRTGGPAAMVTTQ